MVIRFFSISSITEKLSLVVKRFPISILLVVGLAASFFVAVNNDFDDIPYQLWIFFPVGAFISVSAILFTEDFFNNTKLYSITIIAVLLWGVYCFFLPPERDGMQLGKWIEVIVIGAAVFLAMFFIAFLKKNKDSAFWNFTVQMLFQMALACFFSAILFGGLSLALFAIESLFNVQIEGKLYGNLAVLCFALFAPIYFMANIPDKTEKHSGKMFYNKVIKILALYIFTPILAVYTIILYAYLFKIIVVWELPNGWVSWLVSALALGGLLVIALLYPLREQEKGKVATFISRWFGLLILPLLLLMTVGIFRRIADYGITINRCYILLLNIWFYGIYIYLFLTRSLHIKWILISLVIVALITSVGFWNMANITQRSLNKEVSKILNKPVSIEEANALFAGMSQEKRERMKSTLKYLYKTYGKASVQPFFSDTIKVNYWNFASDLGLNEEIINAVNHFSYNAQSESMLNIEKYSKFVTVRYNKWNKGLVNIKYSTEKEAIIINTADEQVFSIPIKEIVIDNLNSDKEERNKKEWIIQGDDYSILVNEINGEYYQKKDSIDLFTFMGCLFYK
jgi:hypothetical protein